MYSATRPVALVGIGNNLLTDDGAGIHVLRALAGEERDTNLDLIDGGTIGLALLDRLSDLDGLVALDAMMLGKPPGSVTVMVGEAMDAHLRKQHSSVHELGLADLLDALRLRGDLPANRALIGIEPADMGWGTTPTVPVAAAIPQAAERARELVRSWRDEAQAGAAP
ncbi:MAG: hydrogenase maturation protease [Woeseiaceae bacterium]|nr:hydrogenase maturation protease [Woeseiaceae bacterium]